MKLSWVAVKKGVEQVENCQLCGATSATGCLNPEHNGESLDACPTRIAASLGGR